MKKLILSLAAVTSLAAANAQSIAPEIGMTYTNMVNNDNKSKTESKLGYRIGANVNFPIANNVYIAPGLFYSTKGGKTTNTTDANTYNVTDINLGYLEVPVNVVYRLPLSVGAIMLSGGGYYAYGLNGKVTTSGKMLGINLDTKTSDVTWGSGEGERKRSDYGVAFGAGYELPVGVYIRGQYQLGLANTLNSSNVTSKNSGFMLTLGYNLNRWNR